ncbi:hypothetical protein F5Y19DRAFT_474582 [Xylariaceae sp. FL1651]|nr:hypothetical protein F5Y19DRAFT_474582 [Xylariaceae sp. FL1651]
MSCISSNISSKRAWSLILIFLGLLTLADNILSNALPIILGPVPPQTPGFWNLTTMALILSTASELVGQLVLGFFAFYYSSKHAMYFNSSSILISSICSLLSLLLLAKGAVWTSALAPVFKVIGGGSHSTAFLTLVLLREQTSGSLRAALIYATGAVIVLCQMIASSVTPLLANSNPILPYILSILCCLLAYVATLLHDNDGSPRLEKADHSSTRPLLKNVSEAKSAFSPTLREFRADYSQIWRSMSFQAISPVRLLGLVFVLASIAKATRPLFITYIQHRVGITPQFANYLWLVRFIMSLFIFAVLLPRAVILLSRRKPTQLRSLTLAISKGGVVLLATGAFFIGLAQSKPLLILGLIVNTLGVATDLSLLAFAADSITEDIASRFFMFIASLESAGTLIGIGFLYPLYQLCLDDHTIVGGVPYYACAALFAVAGCIVWSMEPVAD